MQVIPNHKDHLCNLFVMVKGDPLKTNDNALIERQLVTLVTYCAKRYFRDQIRRNTIADYANVSFSLYTKFSKICDIEHFVWGIMKFGLE